MAETQGISIWGDRFEARINFDSAIDRAKALDAILAGIEERIARINKANFGGGGTTGGNMHTPTSPAPGGGGSSGNMHTPDPTRVAGSTPVFTDTPIVRSYRRGNTVQTTFRNSAGHFVSPQSARNFYGDAEYSRVVAESRRALMQTPGQQEQTQQQQASRFSNMHTPGQQEQIQQRAVPSSRPVPSAPMVASYGGAGTAANMSTPNFSSQREQIQQQQMARQHGRRTHMTKVEADRVERIIHNLTVNGIAPRPNQNKFLNRLQAEGLINSPPPGYVSPFAGSNNSTPITPPANPPLQSAPHAMQGPIRFNPSRVPRAYQQGQFHPGFNPYQTAGSLSPYSLPPASPSGSAGRSAPFWRHYRNARGEEFYLGPRGLQVPLQHYVNGVRIPVTDYSHANLPPGTPTPPPPPGGFGGRNAPPSGGSTPPGGRGGGRPPTPPGGPPQPPLPPQPPTPPQPPRPPTPPNYPSSNVPWGWYNFQRGTGQIGSGFSGARRFLSPHNLMGMASGVYLAGHLGRAVGEIGRQTIGQAMQLEESESLLGVTFTAPNIGINRELGAAMAERLIGATYLSGIDTSRAELGLSRVELAERYRALAPVVRITAQSPEQFQTGVQRSALLSSLLLARDPTQGQGGVNVALSELYSGGPTRFLSLTRRFELSKTRMLEIEASMGGEGTADPAAVAITALEEMGLGVDYLRARARGTLRGQLERLGALFQDTRADAFTSGLVNTRSTVTRLNDAYQSFTESPAYDTFMQDANRVMGGISNFVLGGLTNYYTSAFWRTGGTMDSSTLSRSAADVLESRAGQYIDATGNILEAGEAFRRAAQTISDAHLERLVLTPRYDGRQAMRSDTILGTGTNLLGAMLISRMMGGVPMSLLRGLMGGGISGLAGTWGALGASGALTAGLPGLAVAGGAAGLAALVAAYRNANRLTGLTTGLDPSVTAQLEASNVRVYGNTLSGNVSRMSQGFGDWIANTFTGGYHGEWTYGQRGATAGGLVTAGVEQSALIQALQQNYSTQYQPGTSSDTIRARSFLQLSELEERLRAEGITDHYLLQDDAIPTLQEQIVQHYEQFGQTDTIRNNIRMGIMRSRGMNRAYSVTDPVSGRALTFPISSLGDSNIDSVIEQILAPIAAQDPARAKDLFDELYRNVNETNFALNQFVTTTANATDSVYRYLSVAMVPGLFTGYDLNADPRFIGMSNQTSSASPFGSSLQTLSNLSTRLTQGGMGSVTTTIPAGAGSPPASTATSVSGLPAGSTSNLWNRGSFSSAGYTGTILRGSGPVANTVRNIRLGSVSGSNPSPEQIALQRFFGGQLTDHFGNTGTRFHTGIDYTTGDQQGRVMSVSGGTVDYVSTVEEYAKYGGMFGNNPQNYGITAVVTTPEGMILSYSHLDPATLERYQPGSIAAGAPVGIQGRTGVSMTSRLPGVRLFNGIRGDTGQEAPAGYGNHVHFMMGRPTEGGYEYIDPGFAPDYVRRMGDIESQRAVGAPVQLIFGDLILNFEAKPTSVDELRDQLNNAVPELINHILETAQRDGILDDVLERNSQHRERQGRG